MNVVHRLALKAISIIITLCTVLAATSAQSVEPSDSAVFIDLQGAIDNLKERVRIASPGVVLIIAYDNTGEEGGRGSGFFLDREGKILTRAGFLSGAYSAEVMSEFGSYNDVTILNVDKTRDLGLVQVKTMNATPLEMDVDYKMTPGEKVLIIGKKAGLKETVSEGLVHSIRDEQKDFEHFELKKTIPITYFPESKDGPVLNSSGKVIGITTAAISDHPVFGRDAYQFDTQKIDAISARTINRFLSSEGRIIQLPKAKSRVWFPWLKKQVSNSFVFLYEIGFRKLVGWLLATAVFIACVQWLCIKAKKIFTRAG